MRSLLTPIVLLITFLSGAAQINDSKEDILLHYEPPVWSLKIDAGMSMAQRIGPAVDFIQTSVDTLAVAGPQSAASYERPFQPGIVASAHMEYRPRKYVRIGMGLAYNQRGLEETRNHEYLAAGDSTTTFRTANITSRLHYLGPSGYVGSRWKYFGLLVGFRANIFMGGISEINNNLPSFVSPTGNNYAVEASLESPTFATTNPDMTIYSSDNQNSGYYRFFVEPFIQLRIQSERENNRPYFFINYSPTSDPYKRDLNIADYTGILMPRADVDGLSVPSRMRSFSFGVGWSLNYFN